MGVRLGVTQVENPSLRCGLMTGGCTIRCRAARCAAPHLRRDRGGGSLFRNSLLKMIELLEQFTSHFHLPEGAAWLPDALSARAGWLPPAAAAPSSGGSGGSRNVEESGGEAPDGLLSILLVVTTAAAARLRAALWRLLEVGWLFSAP